jgi:cell division protein FtsB
MEDEMAEEGPARRGLTVLWVVTAVVVGILILGDLNSRMADARQMARDALQLQTDVAFLETQNIGLRTQIAGATSEAAVIEYAHEHAGMVREGERLVVPMPDPNATPAPAAMGDLATTPESRWQVWWALLFGSNP